MVTGVERIGETGIETAKLKVFNKFCMNPLIFRIELESENFLQNTVLSFN